MPSRDGRVILRHAEPPRPRSSVRRGGSPVRGCPVGPVRWSPCPPRDDPRVGPPPCLVFPNPEIPARRDGLASPRPMAIPARPLSARSTRPRRSDSRRVRARELPGSSNAQHPSPRNGSPHRAWPAPCPSTASHRVQARELPGSSNAQHPSPRNGSPHRAWPAPCPSTASHRVQARELPGSSNAQHPSPRNGSPHRARPPPCPSTASHRVQARELPGSSNAQHPSPRNGSPRRAWPPPCPSTASHRVQARELPGSSNAQHPSPRNGSPHRAWPAPCPSTASHPARPRPLDLHPLRQIWPAGPRPFRPGAPNSIPVLDRPRDHPHLQPWAVKASAVSGTVRAGCGACGSSSGKDAGGRRCGPACQDEDAAGRETWPAQRRNAFRSRHQPFSPTGRAPKRTRGPASLRGPERANSGGDLLSQGVSTQVPSAQAGLTSVFGMGTGVAPPLSPPETFSPRLSSAQAVPGELQSENEHFVQPKPSAD